MFYVELHIKHQMVSAQLCVVGPVVPMPDALTALHNSTPSNRLQLGQDVGVPAPGGQRRLVVGSCWRVGLNGLAFHLQVHAYVAPRGLTTRMTEDVTDCTGVGAGLEHMNSRRV